MVTSKLISILLAMVLCLALAACTNETAPQTTPGVETTVETTVETAVQTEPEETTPTDSQETFPTDPGETTAPAEIQNDEPPADSEADMIFTPVEEKVTAKIEVNLRSAPSQGDDSKILHTLENGETLKRTGISDSGWSELTWKGKTCYAVSSYLTTDLDYKPPVQIQTPFTKTDEMVTPKDAVNLRTLPSTKHPDVEVVVKLVKGETVKRTGINEDVGWSRVEWEGQTLYCISSYLRLAEETTE